ncbi:MAG: hypothetical protein ACU826_05360, partial [Gammaproteobacteria bacterium]
KFSTPFGFRNTTSSGRILLKKMNICVFMTMIIAPCFHESLASESIQKHAEFVDSVLVNNKVPVENIESVDFSISQVGQSTGESSTKNGSSISLTYLEVVTPNKISSDTSENEKRNEVFQSQMFILLGFIFAVLIPLFSNYGKNATNVQVKHNAALNGRKSVAFEVQVSKANVFQRFVKCFF